MNKKIILILIVIVFLTGCFKREENKTKKITQEVGVQDYVDPYLND